MGPTEHPTEHPTAGAHYPADTGGPPPTGSAPPPPPAFAPPTVPASAPPTVPASAPPPVQRHRKLGVWIGIGSAVVVIAAAVVAFLLYQPKFVATALEVPEAVVSLSLIHI